MKFVPSKLIALFKVSTLLLNANIDEFDVFNILATIRGSFSIIFTNSSGLVFLILLKSESSIILVGKAGKDSIFSIKSFFILILLVFILNFG